MKMKHENSWDVVKVKLREKCIALRAYIRRKETSKANNVGSHIRELEKEEQVKTKARRKMKIFRAEITEIKNRESIRKMNEAI